ncbi:hypothetical protein RUM44_006862 [Polyplax serrata]|uniref:Serine/threonine-protein kinase SAK n=1 Tax=Polyplax serrata TaxID=468196 RepID=A0ABR1AJA2_POLSC
MENMQKIEDYEVGPFLGKGGFATVYRAKCLRTQSIVAIKMIDKKLMFAAGMISRVRQEVSIHSKLKHPSVLELYTSFEDSNYVYLVLEYCENGELQRFLKHHNKILNESEAYQVLYQVIDGLTYLHSHNIVHRDLTLANLLLTSNMRIKIADFGLATQLMTPNETHVTMCGTPNYISPEVATRSCHGLQVDVWGLGVMLYTLLVGKPPFDTSAIKSTLTRVVMSDYQEPANLSSEAKDLISNLLEKNPKDRLTLPDILKHPFMMKYSSDLYRVNATNESIDSGQFTMSTTINSQRSLNMTSKNSSVRSEDFTSKLKDSQQIGRLDQITEIKNTHQEISIKPTLVDTNSKQLLSFTNSPVYQYHTTSLCKYSSRVEQPYAQRNLDIVAQDCTSVLEKNNYPENILLKKSNSLSNLARTMNVLHNEKNETVYSDVRHYTHCEQPANYSCRIAIDGIKVQPFNSERLQPARHKTNKAVLSILESGEVAIEFIKRKGKEDRVTDCCRISKDGIRVVVYSVNKPLRDKPPDLPELGTDGIYSYENLPQKHWKKYLYAARFVNLVKAKTPKITFYSDQAKCLLMENSPEDFEVLFYSGKYQGITFIIYFKQYFNCKFCSPGSKVSKNGNVVKAIDDCGRSVSYQMSDISNLIASNINLQHFLFCYEHCLKLENSLKELSAGNKSLNCFPIIVGRKPNTCGKIFTTKENTMNNLPISREFTTSISTHQTRAQSTPKAKKRTELLASSRRIHVPGLGVATQNESAIEIEYLDGSKLIFNSNSGDICFSNSQKTSVKYNQTEVIPDWLRCKLKDITQVIPYLINANDITKPMHLR